MSFSVPGVPTGGGVVGSIFYNLSLNTADFDAGVARTNAKLQAMETELGRFGGQLLTTAKWIGIAGGALGAFGAFMGIKFDAQIETARMGFVTLLGSTKKANDAINMIIRDAKVTPFEIMGLIQANEQLTAVTHNANTSERLLMNVGRALAAMGQGQDSLNRVIFNLEQIGAVGHATMMDIRQFAFAGIPIFDLLTQATGKTGAALQGMISNGQITFAVLQKAFEKAGEGSGRFAKAFTNQAGTLTQLWSNMKDIANATLGKIMVPFVKSLEDAMKAIQTAAASPEFIAFVNKISDAVGTLPAKLAGIGDALKNFGGEFRNAIQQGGFEATVQLLINKLATAIIVGLPKTIELAIGLLVQYGPQIINAFITGIVKAAFQHPLDFIQLLLALGFLPGKVITAITTVLDKIPILGPVSSWMIKGFTAAGNFVTAPLKAIFKALGGGAVGALRDALMPIYGIGSEVLNLIRSALSRITGSVLRLARNVGAGLVSAIGAGIRDVGYAVFAGVRNVIGSSVTIIWGFFGRFVDAGYGLIRAFASGIRGAAGAAIGAVHDVLSYVRNLLPFSDAKTGPLSDLTLSGQRFSQTFAKGILQGSNHIQAAATAAVGLATLPNGIYGSGSSSVQTSIYGNINIASEVDANNFLKMLTRNQELAKLGLASRPGSLG